MTRRKRSRRNSNFGRLDLCACYDNITLITLTEWSPWFKIMMINKQRQYRKNECGIAACLITAGYDWRFMLHIIYFLV